MLSPKLLFYILYFNCYIYLLVENDYFYIRPISFLYLNVSIA